MSHDLTFRMLHDYSATANGIAVPVVIKLGDKLAKLSANVDTGASFCIFERGVGEFLEIDVESGTPIFVGTATGAFTAYGHSLTLVTLGYEFDVMVYFAKEEAFNRNVLGRRGWLDQVRLGIVEYEGKMYVGKYDES